MTYEHGASKAAGVFVTVIALVIGLVSPASAAPAPAPTTPPNEGGSTSLASLRDNLESAARGYIEAEALLNSSETRQRELEQRVITAELSAARIRATVATYAAEAYRTGRLGVIGMMLSASTKDDFLAKAMALDRRTHHDESSLSKYLLLKEQAADAKKQIEAEIVQQSAALAEMQKRKTAAERALAAVGATPTRTNIDPSTLPTARPAPRNSDGSWPSESCSVDDPTPANGCVTPRTLHALQETKRLGWNWYVSCYRPGDQFEHPKGRACDWAAYQEGFVNRSATLSNKVYGDRLAGFYAKNAKALGVMYVVWYCQIWLVGSGWRRYNSTGSKCGDSPAGDHTNHVHLSVY